MVLLSCVEDLCVRTLSAIPSVFAKLAYLSDLRTAGRYFHWGLARRYGKDAAEEALAQVHTELWIEVLRTPTPQLYGAFCDYLASSDRPPEDWYARHNDVIPSSVGGGNKLHFAAVALTLAELTKAGYKLPKAA